MAVPRHGMGLDDAEALPERDERLGGQMLVTQREDRVRQKSLLNAIEIGGPRRAEIDPTYLGAKCWRERPDRDVRRD
jgi:hypothetical protein